MDAHLGSSGCVRALTLKMSSRRGVPTRRPRGPSASGPADDGLAISHLTPSTLSQWLPFVKSFQYYLEFWTGLPGFTGCGGRRGSRVFAGTYNKKPRNNTLRPAATESGLARILLRQGYGGQRLTQMGAKKFIVCDNSSRIVEDPRPQNPLLTGIT
jgi:hypothetical protein